MNDAERLTNLELLFTHLERQVHELSEVVLSHQQRIERLERQFRLMQTSQQDAEDDRSPDAGE
jgi:uncharacterized coiled-coil protein SlyX